MKKTFLLLKFIALMSLIFSFEQLRAEGIVVTETAQSGSFTLVAGGAASKLIFDNSETELISIVTEAFAGDIKLLSGVEPAIANSLGNEPSVIIGTLGASDFINQLATSGKIDKARLEGKWESFLISVVNNPTGSMSRALVIAGSDPRGTAFGVFELSRMMGVSPWVWWADVTPATRNAIYVSGDDLFGPPSVKYRGMFINDEDFGIKPWASKNMDPNINDIGPRTHEKLFELMLRTKSNFLWPAMHACTKAFWYYKENPEVARKYQIVLGSSHCEPMLRNNEDEWNRNFSSEFPGVTRGSWNWRNNSTVIKNYWIMRVQEAINTEAIYTMGMRGVHDSQMEGYDNDRDRAEALKTIIASQRDILETYLSKPKETVPQLFCPYKEALLHYNEGIDLPEDVTLLWPDDNHGFIRQLSNPEEQTRSGGGGVYYHFSYWGPPRQDYLWLSSTSPVKTSYEMSKAYELNAKKIWVFNVGDLKPTEYEYQFAMDLAWDVDAWSPENAHKYARFWAEENFGAELAEDIADIQKQHYYLSASGRPDQSEWMIFTAAETEKRLIDYAELVAKVKAVESRVPERLKDAFFQLIVYPVHCSAAMNEKIHGARLSIDYAKLGKKKEALEIADRATKAYQTIRELTQTYNKVIAGGKWDGMMSYSPKSLGFFYAPHIITQETMPNETIPAEKLDGINLISAADFSNKSGTVKVIDELGIAGASVTVWPLNMTEYNASNITSAPYVEYKVQLKTGSSRITVKCLPTFPLYTGLDLRYAISVDGSTPEFNSIKMLENQSEWRLGVLRGFNKGDTYIDVDENKEATIKVYFADPGLVVSAIEVTDINTESMTEKIVNPDFEFDKDGNRLPYDSDGNRLENGLKRGDPYGWTHVGSLNGQSWGTNQDAINYHGDNMCWYSSAPMPSNFELTQTIKDLPAGEYVLRCRLGVPLNRMTTQRLFANKFVQYYGQESDYMSNLTSGEFNSFAGYACDAVSEDGVMISLKEMAVKFVLIDGEDLKIGIRSGNKKGNGTVTNDASGWFKVDYFRLEKVRDLTDQDIRNQLSDLIQEAQNLYNSTEEGISGGQYPQSARTAFQSAIQSAQSVEQNTNASLDQLLTAINTLQKAISDYKNSVNTYTSYIVNSSFELDEEGEFLNTTNPNDSRLINNAYRDTPWGWSAIGKDKLITPNDNGIISYGVNTDASNKDGQNIFWVNSRPMPEFELYQEVKGLPAGKYVVRCRLDMQNGKLTTQRLFANDNAQYFGSSWDYGTNIDNKENNYSFAGYLVDDVYNLQELEVTVEIAEGETLRLGIRTNNIKANGSAATDTEGWFKVDHFRLELKELYGNTGLDKVEEDLFTIKSQQGGFWLCLKEEKTADIRVVSLSGQTVYSGSVRKTDTWVSLPQGLYIVQLFSNEIKKSTKVLVK